MPAGRPSDYTEAIGDLICSELSTGKSLNKICIENKKNKDFPSAVTIYAWLRKNEEFLKNYTRAKEDSADADFENVHEIAEQVRSREIDPQSARVAMDAYKWTAGKKRPKKFGDRIHTEHSGTVNHSSMDQAELERQLQEARQKNESAKKE